MRRILNVVLSVSGMIVGAPILGLVLLLVWLEDRNSPVYVGTRIGRGGSPFGMVKIRTMTVNADSKGPESISSNDPRVTVVGGYVRRLKLDELPQLWNVLKGDMNLVGPRPNTAKAVAAYTMAERELLTVRPGITDFASIVFADEGQILDGPADADFRYNQLIRPWKSRLALHNVRCRSIGLDARIVAATALGVVARPRALRRVQSMLRHTGAATDLVRLAGRGTLLEAAPPPGAVEILSRSSVVPRQANDTPRTASS